MKGNDFIFDFVNLLNQKCHKINLKSCGSYIYSPDLIKNIRPTINPNTEDDKYFARVALNQEKKKRKCENVIQF